MKVIGRIFILMLALPFLILALPVLFIWACTRLCFERRPKTIEVDEETRLMQRIHSDMVRMDRRVEALETLLLERSANETYRHGEHWTDSDSAHDAYARRH